MGFISFHEKTAQFMNLSARSSLCILYVKDSARLQSSALETKAFRDYF